MERYRRVVKHKEQNQSLDKNEIRITSQGLVRNYISYAQSLFRTRKVIVLKAMGQAISKAVAIAEIIKKRTSGLHQDIVISSTNITDVWEPLEEGLTPLEISRQVSLMSITLSKTELNMKSPGYQSPFQKQYLNNPNDARTRILKYDQNEDVCVQGQGKHGRGRDTNLSLHGNQGGGTSDRTLGAINSRNNARPGK